MTNITACGNMEHPKANIRRNLEFTDESTENHPPIDGYINKKFGYGIAYYLLANGHRLARPIGDEGFLVIKHNSKSRLMRVNCLKKDGSFMESNNWTPNEEDQNALDWTLADYSELVGSTLTGDENPNIGYGRLAMLAHEVNRLYCDAINDPTTPTPPDWNQCDSSHTCGMIDGVQFVLANPDAGDSAQHDNWMKYKLDNGWKYGEVKCEVSKTHPCLVPFDQLSKAQQVKDALFRAVVLTCR